MVPLLIMATSLVSKINTRVALVKGWVNSFLAFMGQLYIGFYNYADQGKTDVYHDYAARASALYALSFIRAYVTNERLPQLGGPSSRAGLSEVWNVPHSKISLTRLPITD